MKNIDRKDSFESGADIYNKARPDYPEEIIEYLQNNNYLNKTMDLLELGSGTGKSTILFTDSVNNITCIEPGQEMCKKLIKNLDKYKNITVAQTSFENFNSQKKLYDIILAANSFHWLDPGIKFSKSSDLLKENGLLLLIFNFPHYKDNILLHKGYKILSGYSKQKTFYESKEYDEKASEALIEEINKSNIFKLETYKQIEWERIETVENMLNGIMSHSAFLSLNNDLKKKCKNDLIKNINNTHDRLNTKMLCILYLAKKIN